MSSAQATRISDVYVPKAYDDYMRLNMIEKLSVVQSGIATVEPTASDFLAGPGKLVDIPHWNSISEGDANISSDDPAVACSAEVITAGNATAVRQGLNLSFSTMDVAVALAGSDPLVGIADQVVYKWDTVTQKRMIASWEGVLANNIADDSGDMVYDATTSGTVADVNKFSATNYLSTTLTLGEHMDEIAAIAVHPVVYNRMQVLNLIDYVENSEALTQIATYQGARVVVSKGMPTGLNGANTTYTSFLYGPGAVAIGLGLPKVPSEIDRNPCAGNGGGQESLYDRKELVIHPRGFQWQNASITDASGTPTLAELRTAAQWDRVVTRERVAFAALITNG